jgi:hypothetical protein
MNYDKVLNNLFIGQKIDTQELHDALVKEGVTNVINLWSGNPEPIWKGPVLTLNQEDDGTPRPIDQTRAGIAYAKEVFSSGGILYVHCQWALRRAPSLAYGILRSLGYTSSAAKELINLSRPRCNNWWDCYIPSIEAAL